MKKKRIKILIILIVIVLLSLTIPVGIRFIKYAKIMGYYYLVDGEGYKEMHIGFKKWSMGRLEDRKCDLWGCSGYESGNNYYIKDNKLYFYYDRHSVFDTKHEIIEDSNGFYILLKDRNNTTYKKDFYKKGK
jgi:hypothetical protein